MAAVLTTASSITCTTQGKVSASGESKLKADGAPVLVESGVAGKPVSSCASADNPDKGILQCKTVAAVTSGKATKLTVGGAPVLLDTFAGKSSGVHPPPDPAALSATANQSKLKAV